MILKITSYINTGSGQGGQFGVGINSIYWTLKGFAIGTIGINIYIPPGFLLSESLKCTTLTHPIPDSLMLATWKVNLRKAIVNTMWS